MPAEKHSLINELPEYKERIHEMKMQDAHFAKMFHQYHEVDAAIHHIESGAGASSDERLEKMKKERLKLKDDLFAALKLAS